MQTLKTLASIVLSLPGLASCGGEDASAGAVSLGISSNKALSAVTREEATRGCARLRVDVGARFNPTTLKRKVCTLTAASFSHDESECASRRDSCVQDPSSVDYDPADHVACGGENVDDWQGCTTTVGELETCLNDLLDGLDAMLNTFTCKDAGKVLGSNCKPPPLDPSTGQILTDPATGRPYEGECGDSPLAPSPPSSCRALQTNCPTIGLLDD